MTKDFLDNLNEILRLNHGFINSKYNLNISEENVNSLRDISKLRVQQIELFKRYPEFLSKLEKDQIIQSIQSSGTSGNPSRIFLARDSVKRQKLNLAKLFSNRFPTKNKKLIIYDLDPSIEGRSGLGARYAASIGYANQCKDYYFAFKKGHNGRWDLKDDFNEHIRSESLEVIHFGFTYILFQYVADLDINFFGSKLFHIGGWKKLNDRAISKDMFNRIFENKNCAEVIDVYGFTELMGESFFDCPAGWKHFTENTMVSVRDVLNPLEHRLEGKGLLQFTSTFPVDYLGNNILTDDVGEVIVSKTCSCGLDSGRFKFLTRRENSAQRGCGDILGEKVSNESLRVTDAYHLFNWQEESFITFANEEKHKILPASFPDIEIEDILNVLDILSNHWLDKDDLSYLQKDGLSYLAKWCSAENLQKILLSCLGIGDVRHLNSFYKVKDGSYHLILPKGQITHWVAGNVPLLGMLIIVQGIISRNRQIVKLSSDAGDQLQELLLPLRTMDFGSEDLNSSARQILDSIQLIKIERKNYIIQNFISEVSNTRVIWGGKYAVQDISSFNRCIGANDIVLGPRTSFSMVNGKYFLSNPVLSRRLAKDISSFDQNACSSPHSIFIKGEEITLIADSLKASLKKEIKEDLAFDYVEQALKFLRLQNFGETYFDASSGFIICQTKFKENLLLPEFNKVIYLIEIESYEEIDSLLNENVQSISLIMSRSEKLDLAMRLAKKGVTRFPEAGVMTEFDKYWDSYNVMAQMIKYSVLNGPYI